MTHLLLVVSVYVEFRMLEVCFLKQDEYKNQWAASGLAVLVAVVVAGTVLDVLLR